MTTHARKKGLSFGLTSGVITTLGLLIGLSSSGATAAVVLSGILVIAIADALSDALGMHLAEESADGHTAQSVWQATLSTFATKFIVAMTFVVPVLLLPMNVAIIVAAIWGLALIGVFSYLMAKPTGEVWGVVVEHLGLTIAVIAVTHYIGVWLG